MALFGKFDDSYTKTGKGTLTSWANGLSFVPFLRNIPVLGTTITGLLGYADTIIEAGSWLLRGKFGSAATVAIAGVVGTSVNAIEKTAFWWANAASGITTGTSLGTHARALTESVIGGVTGALGSKPTVLSSYPAGIGSINSGQMQQGPGIHMTAAARSRGEDPNAAYARMRSGNPEHLAALEAAAQQQGGYRAM
jgi:hypothetical protein